MTDFPSFPNRSVPSSEISGPLPARDGYPAGFAGHYREGDDEPADLSLLDFFRMMRRRWLLVLSFAAGCLGIALYQVRTVPPPQYQAGAVIRLYDTQKTLTGMDDPTRPNVGATNAVMSLIQVLRSEAVLGDAIDRSALRLRLANRASPPRFLQQVEVTPDAPQDALRFQFSDSAYIVAHVDGATLAQYGEPVDFGGVRFTIANRPEADSAEVVVLSRGSVLGSLRSGLVATPRPNTDVVDVRFTGATSPLAQLAVNEIVEAFQRTNTAMARQQSMRRRVFLEEQLEQATAAQQEAQLALGQFRGREQLYSSQSRMSAEQSGLMGTDLRREELLAERRFYDSVLDELERSPAEPGTRIITLAASADLRSNPVVSSLLQQLIRYEAAREELITGETGLRPDHPDVRREEALIASTQERLLAAVRSHLEAVDSRIAALNRLQQRGSQQMRQLSDVEAEEVRLVQRVQAAGNLASSLESELQKAKLAEAVETGQVEILERASGASSTGGGRSYVTIFMGLVIGLLLGGGCAFVVEHLNTSIKHQGELEKLLRIRGLGVIPRIPLSGKQPLRLLALPRIKAAAAAAVPGSTKREARAAWSSGPAVATHSASVGAEAYRMVRTSLIGSQAVNTRARTAVVTSAAPREGKTTTAANLAVAFAQHGMTVLLVDADLRRPRQHEVFTIPQSPGMTDVLLGHAVAADAIHATPVNGLSVLPAGTMSPYPAELLGGKRMQQLLAELAERFDLILLDTPPLLSVADPAILSVRTDGAIVVIHAGRTNREAVQAAVQKLNAVGAQVLGAVLNDRDAKVPQYAPYNSYSYSYSSVS